MVCVVVAYKNCIIVERRMKKKDEKKVQIKRQKDGKKGILVLTLTYPKAVSSWHALQ